MTEARLGSREVDGDVVVTVAGELDLENAGRTRQRLADAVPRSAQGIVLDLSGVSHLDSAGIRLIFELAARVREHRQDLAVVAPPESIVRDVLHVVSLERVASIVASLEDGLAGVRARRAETGA